jgi:SulP family sulfate permease
VTAPASTGPSLAQLLPNLEGASRAIGPDLFAGLAVAALAIPQGMAYALVAGLPPEMGLLAGALPVFFAAFFGSSPYLTSGPTNPLALLVGASIVAPAVAVGGEVPRAMVLEAGLLAGMFLLAFGLFDLGRTTRFVSDSVIAGFAAGAGLRIALGSLPDALGAPVGAVPVSSGTVPEIWDLLRRAAISIAGADVRALGLAVAVPATVLIVRRLDPRVPGALLGLAGAGAVVAVGGWAEGPDALAVVGPGLSAVPAPAAPIPADPVGLAAPALAIALLATVQTIAAARTLPMPRGQRFDPNRELFGQGIANVVAAFIGAIPVCGSLTRSALARAAGARSRLAPAASGLIVAFGLALLAPWIAYVPIAALGGLVVFLGLDLINPVALRRSSTTRGDTLVLAATLAATLWIDLVQAVYVGLLLSLGLLVRRAGTLRVFELAHAGERRFREIPVDSRTGASKVVLLNLEGHLSFAVAPDLRDRLLEIAGRGAEVMVVRIKRAPSLDATVLEGLRRIVRELDARGTRLLLCGLTEEKVRLIRKTELGRELGPDRLIPTGPRLAEGLENAIRVAREMVSDDEGEVFRTEASSTWTYEI